MKKFLSLPALSLLAILSIVPAHAGLVLIDSAAGLDNNATGTSVAINPHPAWQTNNPDGSAAVWISHKDSGYMGSEYVSTGTVVEFYHNFSVGGAGWLDLKVWADDTAGVYLSNDGGATYTELFAPNPNPNVTCSTNAIGCLPDKFGAINHALTAGDYTLKFVVSQVGTGLDTASNPFGLLYTGSATFEASDVPEPAAFLLTGIGLVGVGILRRRVQNN